MYVLDECCKKEKFSINPRTPGLIIERIIIDHLNN